MYKVCCLLLSAKFVFHSLLMRLLSHHTTAGLKSKQAFVLCTLLRKCKVGRYMVWELLHSRMHWFEVVTLRNPAYTVKRCK